MARSFYLTLESAVYVAVASPIEVVFTPFEERLLASAAMAIAEGYFGFAVIVAHTACELGTERAISQSFAASGVGYLEEPVADFIFTYNLKTERVRNLYSALRGRRVQEQPFWPEFTKSVKRRNSVFHDGKFVTKSEAEASLAAASDLVAYLRS
jgi:hypothetical protein